MVVRYYIRNESLEGLDKLLQARHRCTCAKDLEVWKKDAEAFFFQNTFLRQFNRQELHFNIGDGCVLQVVSDRPEMSVEQMRLELDRRFLVPEPAARVHKVTISAEFDLTPTVADRRGYFTHLNDPFTCAYVSWHKGGYMALVEAKCTVNLNTDEALGNASALLLDIIEGKARPEPRPNS